MSNVSPTGLPFMVVGLTSISPFPISTLGLATDPMCLLTVNADVLVGSLGVIGSTASLLLPIPANSTLAGAQIYVQGAQLELTTNEWNLSDQGTATLGF
jgi:hypothetical protein